MLIGPRVIEGQIHEREQARQIYGAAKAEGRKASLVEQQRPNVFTTAVANIGPNETVEVMLEYQDTVRFDGVQYALRFPLVVAPRYMPDGGALAGVGFAPRTAGLADAGRIDGPVRRPGDGPANPLTLAIDLDAGFPLGSLDSLYHPISVREGEAGRRHITLAEGSVPNPLARPQSFDLVVANISARIGVERAPFVLPTLKPGGWLIASGIINDQLPVAREGFAKAGFTLRKEYPKDDWTTLVFQAS